MKALELARRRRDPSDVVGQQIELARVDRRARLPFRAQRARRLATLGLVLLDAAMLALLFWAVTLVHWEHADDPTAGLTLLGSALATIFVMGGYRVELAARGNIAQMAAIALPLGLSAGYLLLKLLGGKLGIQALAPPALFGLLLVAAVLVPVAYLSRWYIVHRVREHARSARIVFIGDAEHMSGLSARLAAETGNQGLVHLRAGVSRQALQAALDEDVRQIVLGCPVDALSPEAIGILIHSRVNGIAVSTPVQFHEQLWESTPLDDVSAVDAWFLHDEGLMRPSLVYRGVKRALDLVLASVMLLLASPLMVLIALAVAVSSRGPIFFRQVRHGLWREQFTMLKFRTMRDNSAEAEEAAWADKDDARITPVGRWLRRSHLDELPQLLNVLSGQMSLVGPRPEQPAFNEALEVEIPYYDLRHLVKPGITGWAQVSSGYTGNLDDAVRKLEYDIFYVKRASLLFDLRILARTVPVVLRLGGW